MPDIDPDASNPEPPAPEKTSEAELLAKTLALQIARERRERGAFSSSGGGHRPAFRVWSLVLIVALMLAALFVLDWMLAQIPRPRRGAQPAAESTPAPAAAATPSATPHFLEKR